MADVSPAIIIWKFPIKEADLILTLLTREFGKIKAISFGGQSTSKRFIGSPDILECGIFELDAPRANSDLYRISNITNKITFPTMREDITRFTLASFCIEICNLFSYEDAEETKKFFNPLYHALNNINKKEVSETQCYCVVLFYTLTILNIAGFNPIEYQGCNNSYPQTTKHFKQKNNLAIAEDAIVTSLSEQQEIDVKIWFSKMLDFNSPILFDSCELIQNGFSFIKEFIEVVSEKRLKTIDSLLLFSQ